MQPFNYARARRVTNERTDTRAHLAEARANCQRVLATRAIDTHQARRVCNFAVISVIIQEMRI